MDLGTADEKTTLVSRIAVFGLIIPIMNVLLSAILNGEPLFELGNTSPPLCWCAGGSIWLNRPAAGKKKEN